MIGFRDYLTQTIVSGSCEGSIGKDGFCPPIHRIIFIGGGIPIGIGNAGLITVSVIGKRRDIAEGVSDLYSPSGSVILVFRPMAVFINGGDDVSSRIIFGTVAASIREDSPG